MITAFFTPETEQTHCYFEGQAPADLFKEVTLWENTSKCASLAPDRTLSFLLGA